MVMEECRSSWEQQRSFQPAGVAPALPQRQKPRDVQVETLEQEQRNLHIAVGQRVAEVPADGNGDHLRRKLEPGKRRPVKDWTAGFDVDACDQRA